MFINTLKVNETLLAVITNNIIDYLNLDTSILYYISIKILIDMHAYLYYCILTVSYNVTHY